MGKYIERFEGVYGGKESGREMLKKEDCWSSVTKELCVKNTWFQKQNQGK